MMVAHTYKHSSPPSTEEKGTSAARKMGRKRPVNEEKREGKAQRAPSGQAFLPSPSSPSKPMIIPTRTRDSVRKRPQRRSSNEGEQEKSRDISQQPRKSTASIKNSSLDTFSFGELDPKADTHARPIIIKSNERIRREERLLRKSVSSSSPKAWDLLLSPPQTEDFESSSYESEATLGPRSISTESAPSLLEDEGSISSSSVPTTPGLSSSSTRGEKRSKSLSTSYGEDCILSHPLRSSLPEPILESDEELPKITLSQSPSPPRSLKSFKSNLSASIRAIRSAARSFSDLAPPLREDHLSRSLLTLNLPYTTERHPLSPQYHDPPILSPSDLHIHHDANPDLSCHSAVQLQSYTPGARQSAHASSPPIFHANPPEKSPPGTDALDTEDAGTSSAVTTGKDSGHGNGSAGGAGARQRELRENRDFLRVIVLEMNMRKCGKLGEREPGRARLWLPARRPGEGSTRVTEKAEEHGLEGRVPARWVELENS